MIDVVVNFADESDKRRLWGRMKSLKGKQSVCIKLHRDTRSNRQNAYLWGVVYPHVAAGMSEAWGEAVTADDVHIFCKTAFLSRPLVDHTTGEEKGRVYGSTAKLDTAAFGEYVNRIIRFAAEELSTEIPGPGEILTPSHVGAVN